MATDGAESGSEIELELEEYPLVFAWDNPLEPEEIPSYLTCDPYTQELGLVLGDTQETLSGCIHVRVYDSISAVVTYSDTTPPEKRHRTCHLAAFFHNFENDNFWVDITSSCDNRTSQVYERLRCDRGYMFKIKVMQDWDPLTFEFIFERLDAVVCDNFHSKSRKLKAEIRELKQLETEAAEGLLKRKTAELERLREEQLLAVAMGFHMRLGSGSVLRGLDPHIIAGLVAPHL